MSKMSWTCSYIEHIPSTMTIFLDLTGIEFGFEIPVPLTKYSGVRISMPFCNFKISSLSKSK